jgi:ABC-type phosphate transport system substrate-binding protein
MKKLLAALLVVAATLLVEGRSDAGPDDAIFVVVNPANPAAVMTREELRPIFQTTKGEWPDGVKAEPINLADESSVRHSFDVAVLGLDPDRVARYWVDRKIRGGERPPRKVSSASAVVQSVAGDKGGVAYVLRGDVNASVKVVARIEGGKVVAP